MNTHINVTTTSENEGESRRMKVTSVVLDGAAFVAAAGLGVWLEMSEPNQKYINPDLLWRYSYPHGENSVPTIVVPIIAFVVPFICIAALPRRFNPNMRRDRALGGLCAAVGLTWVVTCGVKSIIGGIRPDFVDRCWPDGNKTWISPGVPKCSGDSHDVQEGRRSFPSGHTSMSFAGFVYVSLYLAAWLRIGRDVYSIHNKWHGIWKLCIVTAPIVLASFIGLSRVHDYWHHWEDVVVGALLGTSFAVLAWIHKRPYVRSKDIESYTLLMDGNDVTPHPSSNFVDATSTFVDVRAP